MTDENPSRELRDLTPWQQIRKRLIDSWPKECRAKCSECRKDNADD